jgi:hypothetical protein
MAGKGAPRIHDWEALFKEFEKVELKMLQTDWCIENGLSPTNTSREFAKIRNRRAEEIRNRANRRFLKALPDAVEGVITDMQDDDADIRRKNREIVLRTTGILDQNSRDSKTQVNILIPPLFSGAYAIDAQRMLDGPVNIGSGEGTSGPAKVKGSDEGPGSGQAD